MTDMPGLTPALQIDGPLAHISLRRPALANRLEVGDLHLLRQQLAEVNRTESVRVLLLSGQGRHFCSGFNISAVPGLDAGQLFEELADALEQARPVTVARIQGGVYGGATDLALACDFRLGLARCEMFVPAARLGLHFYRGGMQRYLSRMGLQWTKRILLAGAALDGEQMLGSGFLDELLADEEALDGRIQALQAQLLDMAPLALLGMKKQLNALAAGRLDAQSLQQDLDRANASADLREGVAAWQAGRKPSFRGL